MSLAVGAASRRFLLASGNQATVPKRFSSSPPLVRQQVTPQERAALRAARRERAAHILQQQNADGAGAASAGGSRSATFFSSRWVWYASVGVPTALLVWGFNDENSPPAQLSEMIGLTGLIRSYTDDFSKPSYDKLLPDWSQVSAI